MHLVKKEKKAEIRDTMFYLVNIISQCHNGSYNFMRKTVISHCLDLVKKGVFVPQSLINFEMMSDQLDTISNWEE
jgi:hypothetical protein